MIKLLMLTHFDQTQAVILKCNFFNDVSEDILSQYKDNDLLHSVTFFSKNLISVECNYEIYDKELLTIIYCLKN